MKKYISVQFTEGIGTNPFEQSYQFLTDIEDLAAGDKVVVDTKRGVKVANVVGYDELPKVSIANFKWVIQKVDMAAHNIRLEKERKMNSIKRKMEARRKQLEEIQLFALLAKEDEDMKALLDEYNDLNV